MHTWAQEGWHLARGKCPQASGAQVPGHGAWGKEGGLPPAAE